MTNSCPPRLVQFGDDLRKFLESPEGLRLVSGFCAANLGWREGLCWMLADALQRWIGPETTLWAVVGTSKETRGSEAAFHIAVKVGSCYLDGEGASTEDELLAWVREGGVRNARMKKFARKDREGLIYVPRTTRAIVRMLEEVFGPGDRVLKLVNL